jgi:dGTP triphosphohydrolase
MARPSVIDKDKVFAYLNECHEAGNPVPTLSALREKIGGGSFSTYAALIQEWSQNKDQTEIGFSLRLDKLKREQLEQLILDLFAPILPFVLSDLKRTKENCQNQIDNSEVRISELLSENEDLRQENKRRYEEKEQVKAEYETRLTQIKSDYAVRVKALSESYDKKLKEVLSDLEARTVKATEERIALQMQNKQLIAEVSELKKNSQITKQSKAQPSEEDSAPVEDTRSGNLFDE